MIDYLLEKYAEGEITIGKAAKLAKKDIREMMILASKRKIPLQYTLKELQKDFLAAKKQK